MLASLPSPERDQHLASLSDDEAAALEFEWRGWWARRNQIAPPGEWSVWAIIAGRGFGKTRAGAEWVRESICGSTPLARGRCSHIALVAETAADARKVMVGDGLADAEGSGILQVHPKGFRPTYNPSLKRLTWPNGAIASLYNATEPDELRGPQHDGAWCDEIAKWRYLQDTWDQLQFGLRLGDPRVCITTTPRPLKLLKEILSDTGTLASTGSTYENRFLSPKYIDKVVRKYEGTRLGRQELLAEIIEDVPGALWQRGVVERLRIRPAQLPRLVRVVVAIDPGANSKAEDPDETGIIAAGLGADGHGYVLEDASEVMAPDKWAATAITLFENHQADFIVAEINNGGEMVGNTIRMANRSVPFRSVYATRGKVMRAEPVSLLYEKGMVHHVGAFPKLEDQMCAFTHAYDRNKDESPDRMDAMVWALTALMVEEIGTSSTGHLVGTY